MDTSIPSKEYLQYPVRNTYNTQWILLTINYLIDKPKLYTKYDARLPDCFCYCYILLQVHEHKFDGHIGKK